MEQSVRVPARLSAVDFQAMFEVSDMCTLVHDGRTKEIIWANGAACRMLEYDLRELLPLRANHISGLAQQYDRMVARALLQDALETGVSRVRWELRSKSGRLIPTDAFAVRIDTADGPAVMVQYRDLEREHATDEQDRLAARYVTSLTRHTSTIALMLDGEGRIRTATDTALGYLAEGRSPETVVGCLVDEVAALYADGVRIRWSRIADDAEPLRAIRLEIARESAPATWLEGSVERLTEDGGEQSYLVFLHDVSDRVHDDARRELEQRQEDYLARYNAMGDLAMAIAHELGQPLAAARNFIAGARTRLASDRAEGDPERTAAVEFGLDSARSQLDRASTIVSTLRTFVGHLEHIEQVVDLGDILRECMPFIQLRAQAAGVAVEVRHHPVPIPVRCERVLTGQVVLNLCFNAIDEMAAWGEDAHPVLVTAALVDGEAVLSVTDRGRGLTRDPFAESFTEKSSGSGIGLALSYRIITRQHGRIWHGPGAAGGSVFAFAFPLATADEVSDRAAAESGAGARP
ncbi:PAS domain-containing sensor histidine kinase [Microbacterium gorillae]|uniref:PAS domain-containing sensor histidine kinase n=1 Tax=Microbacterium gorillae TaxID=1231063 RepID=UPI00058C5127|nr:PAS domain-containing sensor histidine kinase [Microbacterium gorillae]